MTRGGLEVSTESGTEGSNPALSSGVSQNEWRADIKRFKRADAAASEAASIKSAYASVSYLSGASAGLDVRITQFGHSLPQPR
jgi:hypothetical protein